MSKSILKLAQKSALVQREVIAELEALAKSFDRSEKMIVELKDDMDAVNATHKDRKTTREDIAYLEDLLRCAKKKLVWEKQMEKLRERTPEIMKRVSEMINDQNMPPSAETRATVLQSLQSVQAAMERLEKAKS